MRLSAYFAGLLLFICSTLLSAESLSITLITPEGEQTITIEQLRDLAGESLEIYDPFKRETLSVRGIELPRFIEHFAATHTQASALRFVAADDYATLLNDWNQDNWLLVTHEQGQPLRLRDHGPVKLVEKQLGTRNPENLRNFNDWVWMIKQIEVVE
ncbi:MAG: hypothetical protein ACK4L8_02860 [Nitrincola lacisaponensis]|uniref:Oxidoreductase molybdopterin-binding domain-containing protein n=1 Tax=Nitrincola lacisaponensis TaxID=267850 RepID=A0A063Y4E4_9GAMM|nr:hypothetical protein [Nitrincola lacisaponensis]KDE40529.1 hypothetical protein ADINL_1121 [Nitrincola lacisaponensis]